jgi:hypothetical protein
VIRHGLFAPDINPGSLSRAAGSKARARDWLKCKNSAAPAAKREAEEDGGKKG